MSAEFSSAITSSEESPSIPLRPRSEGVLGFDTPLLFLVFIYIIVIAGSSFPSSQDIEHSLIQKNGGHHSWLLRELDTKLPFNIGFFDLLILHLLIKVRD